MSSLQWKLDRLRAMGAAEILHRIHQHGQTRIEQLGLRRSQPPQPDLTRLGRAWLEQFPDQMDAANCVETADRILAGGWPVFDQPAMQLGFPPDWNRDPKTGIQAPMTFGKMLDYRHADLVGDIKYLWEPNRHLELVTLAQAWRDSADTRYIDGIRTLLDSWFAQCPYPLGPNWVSSLEVAVRLINWSTTWYMLGGPSSPIFDGADGGDFRQRWLDAVFHHCSFIRGYLSRHSSANNHLLGELAGLFIASITWPCWKESDAWRHFAQQELENEVLKQNTADGVNREQAMWYQHEVMDMMLLVLLHGQANQSPFSEAFRHRLEAMLDFLDAVMDVGGNTPLMGDGDDALMVRFDRRPDFDPFRSLLATGAVMFERPDFARKAGRFDNKSRWLLGDAAATVFARLLDIPSEREKKRAFPEGGYWILGSDFGTAAEIRMVADAGPLGYLSIAAHGHADALSLSLSVGGQPLLIDPGTYSYHASPPWRNYFRGTSAHNTLRVDGQDQSLPAGKFLWLRHAHAACVRWESTPERDQWEGWHDGYHRLSDPVTHRRSIELDKPARRLVVTDQLACRTEHDIEIYWHFSEAWWVEGSGRSFEAVCGYRRVGLELDVKLSGEVVVGDKARPAGWISHRYGVKTASPTLVAQGRIRGDSRFRTVFDLSEGGAA